MLIKPELADDEEIVRCLQDAYGLDVKSISFLPIGADFNTAVYRVRASNQTDYFLKLRRGEFINASVSVPKYLADLGIKQVIPPLATKTRQLWSSVASFKAILYPYVEGRNGIEAKLSEDQWIQFGAAIKKLHSTNIPNALTSGTSREVFSSKWRETVKTFLIRQDAICYYRFERIIQDIGEYCEYIFLSDEGGEDRAQSFKYLQSIFLPDGAIERAYQSNRT